MHDKLEQAFLKALHTRPANDNSHNTGSGLLLPAVILLLMLLLMLELAALAHRLRRPSEPPVTIHIAYPPPITTSDG